jgi:hypothetical protein
MDSRVTGRIRRAMQSFGVRLECSIQGSFFLREIISHSNMMEMLRNDR